jgi:hypothetical protein
MTSTDTWESGCQLSRRQLLTRAVAGAATLTSLGLIAPAGLARVARAASRPDPASAFDAEVPARWFDRLLVLIEQTPGFSPPVAARAIGYAGVTLYESVVGGMRDHRTLAGVLESLPPLPSVGHNRAYHWPTAANAALAEVLRLLFPTAQPAQLAAIDDLEAGHAAAVPPGIRDRSIAHGQAIARAIFAWSLTDGGHEGYLRNFPADYTPPVGPGLWEPTPPAFQPALQPWWGSNRPFLSVQSDACAPAPPITYSTDPASSWFAEADEVYRTVNVATAEQLAIAEFWSDDPGRTPTPPGHSISILTQVLRQRSSSLADAAEAYARVGIAVSDAFIGCWQLKYRHNVVRPITFVRSHIDPGWGNPLPLVTPPFPEYTSGHSVQSAAAATVLGGLFGDVGFVDHTHDERGMPARAFTSFRHAAEEAAISRLYGGIHFRAAIERGLEQGRCIGTRAAALPLQR